VTRSTLALLLCLSCGCARAGTRGEAPGTYVLTLRIAADTLWVVPDGSYTHVYAPGGGKVRVARGGWEYETVRRRPVVTFHHFPVRDYDGFVPESGRTGTWPAYIGRTAAGSIVLPVDDGKGLNYRRVSPGMLGSAGRGR
jgi:hypothetical protein